MLDIDFLLQGDSRARAVAAAAGPLLAFAPLSAPVPRAGSHRHRPLVRGRSVSGPARPDVCAPPRPPFLSGLGTAALPRLSVGHTRLAPLRSASGAECPSPPFGLAAGAWFAAPYCPAPVTNRPASRQGHRLFPFPLPPGQASAFAGGLCGKGQVVKEPVVIFDYKGSLPPGVCVVNTD